MLEELINLFLFQRVDDSEKAKELACTGRDR